MKLENYSARYMDQDVIQNINLEIDPGEIHAIWGSEGSGKSVLSQSFMGHPNITIDGKIYLGGDDISQSPVYERNHFGLHVCWQSVVPIMGFTNWELVKSQFIARSFFDCDVFLEDYRDIAGRFGLPSNFPELAHSDSLLSAGEIQMGEITSAVMMSPEMLVLDSIDTELDEDQQSNLVDFLTQYKTDNTHSILVLSENLDFLKALVPDCLYILSDGELELQPYRSHVN